MWKRRGCSITVSLRATVEEIRQARVRRSRILFASMQTCGRDPSLAEFMTRGSHLGEIEWGDAQGNPDRLVGLVPTGGTTGPAKGVLVTSLAWGTMIEMASHYWRCDSAEPVCLSVAPLSHAAGVVAFALFP